MARQKNRFTVYDMLEAKGAFESNPANIDSRDNEGAMLYKGPIPYPKMMYHPEGKRRITAPGEIIVTPMGPKEVGVQTEIINRTVQNEADELALREQGWHDHPAKAMIAAGEDAPSLGDSHKIADLEAQIRSLMAEKADLARAAREENEFKTAGLPRKAAG